jgi:hypothetical protein
MKHKELTGKISEVMKPVHEGKELQRKFPPEWMLLTTVLVCIRFQSTLMY